MFFPRCSGYTQCWRVLNTAKFYPRSTGIKCMVQLAHEAVLQAQRNNDGSQADDASQCDGDGGPHAEPQDANSKDEIPKAAIDKEREH